MLLERNRLDTSDRSFLQEYNHHIKKVPDGIVINQFSHFLTDERKVYKKLITFLVLSFLLHFLIIEPIRIQVYDNILFPIIGKYSPYVFNLIGVDLEYRGFIMSYFNQYRFVDVIIPFGMIFWIPFLFLIALKIKTLYKTFFIYHIVSFALLYPIGILILSNFDALNLFFNLFQMIMIFMGLTFCIIGAKQSVRLRS